MAIITISRGTFSGGNELAALVAGRLGYRLVSREFLFERVAESHGVCDEELADLMKRAPDSRDQAARKEHRRILAALQATLCDLLVGDDVVYHGQVGHLLLPGVKHVLRVRLIAPRAMRIQMAASRERISELDAAHEIDAVDAERERWIRYFHGVDVNDPALYDMVLNLEQVVIADAAAMVVYAARQPSHASDDESRARLRDVALESRIRARLLADTETADLDVRVQVSDGRVRLGGQLDTETTQRVVAAVAALPGVSGVEISAQS